MRISIIIINNRRGFEAERSNPPSFIKLGKSQTTEKLDFRNPAVPRLSFATRFAHIFATGNEIQKYFSARNNSPVPRLSIATRFDTKLREKSFEKQNSAKAVLFTMYVSTV